VTSFPLEESRMITWDFIIALFCEVDEQMRDVPKHPHASLWPSAGVTLGLRSCIGSGSISKHGSRSPWRHVICWYNGMAYPLMGRTSYPSRSLS
jgi:hypothetical protein